MQSTQQNRKSKGSPYSQRDQVIRDLKQTRYFMGHPGRFWPVFLEHAIRLARARLGLLLVQDKDRGTWKKMSIWPGEDIQVIQSPDLTSLIEQVAHASVTSGCSWTLKKASGTTDSGLVVLGLRLELHEDDRQYVAAFLIDGMYAESVEQTVKCLKLVADTPAIYQQGRKARQALNDAARFSGALDLMVLLNAERRYMAAAMTFANEISSRFRCTRVSLGWLDKGYIRLQAVSHMERFEKKMDIVQTLEAAMEEAFDQNEEVLWPPCGESTAVVRDHEAYSREQDTKFMVSVPIRLEDAPVGVLTCERDKEHFTEEEVRWLRILCDQAARRLGDLEEHDRWIGARCAAVFRKGITRLLGVEHTFAKCMGLLVCGALAFLLFGTLPYRIEAPFILRSDDVRYLPAPFKGYIDEVNVKVGEEVEKDDILLSLDTSDLLLEESEAIANQIRYTREAEKARAENSLAEMNIALALAEQARARLDLVRYRLSRADLRAPIRGIIVEGDLEKLLGAPVEKGDVLFKVSRIEKMYAELKVAEVDIHELASGAEGEISFVSQPDLTFPIKVEQIDPVALAEKDEGNVFVVRCLSTEGIEDWWRPGMSGIAKVSAGKRNALWILTHRTMDFFRMKLWW